MTLIDPPTRFDTTETWRKFKVEMEGLVAKGQTDEAVLDHLQMAKDELARRETKH